MAKRLRKLSSPLFKLPDRYIKELHEAISESYWKQKEKYVNSKECREAVDAFVRAAEKIAGENEETDSKDQVPTKDRRNKRLSRGK